MYLYPMIWTNIVGQENIKRQLEQLISTNQVPHAQLFVGLSGHGSLPLSLEFALTLLGATTETSSMHSLGKKTQHPDLHFVYPVVKRDTKKVAYSSDYSSEWFAFLNEVPYGNYNDWFEAINVVNKQGIIGVGEIEKLHRKMFLKPYLGENKVCVLWGVDKMNKEASNAFLKLLEEPPKKTFFILLAEDRELLLPTLISRCQQINFPPILNKDLKASLPDEMNDKNLLISQSEGDYGRLQKLLFDTDVQEHEAILIKGLRTAFKAKGNKSIVIDLMEWSNELSVLGRETQMSFLNYGTQFFRDAFLLNYSLQNLVHYRSKNNFDLKNIAPFINSENIQNLVSLFETSHYHISRNANPKMVFAELGLQLTRLINKASS